MPDSGREIIGDNKCAPVGTPMGSHCGNKWSSPLALDSKVGEIDPLLLPRCLQDSVLESLHNQQGHQRVERTERLVRARCYWPTLHKDVQTWGNLCERCTLGRFLLRTLSKKKKRRWAEHVHEVVNAYNLTPHSSTGYAPFYLMFGRDSRQPIDLLLGTGEQEVEPSDWVSRHQQRLQEAYQLARRQLVHEADSRKKHYDLKGRDLPLSFGRVYRRKRDIRGHNRIQYVWEGKVCKVVARKGKNDVYVIEPANGFGELRTANRVDLRLCPPTRNNNDES